MSDRAIARRVAECCRRLAGRGLIAGGEGNVSIRLGTERVLITPTGLLKAELTPDDMVEVDLSGRRVRGHRKPSSELDLHLKIFGARPDIGAVVHAHPPTATGFGVAGVTFDSAALPELIVLLGSVPIAPYGMPGTPELGERVGPLIARHDAVLMANHGAVTVGGTLEAAWMRMETLEQAARILFVARLLGGARPLSPEDVARLEALRRDMTTDGY